MTFTNPFPLTVVSHCFKRLSLHLSQTASPFRSWCTCYFKKKIEVIVWKLFVHPCDPLQDQMATSNNILTSFPPSYGIRCPSCYWRQRLCFILFPLTEPEAFAIRYFSFCPLSSTFPSLLAHFLQPIHILQTSIQKRNSTNKTKLTSLPSGFHCHYHSISLLSNSFKVSRAAVCQHYLQFLRLSHPLSIVWSDF